jgi:DNA-binding transcriptional regulator YhcF (GntR family)
MKFKDHKPIFLQIAEHICDEILQGHYPEGERLPSVREYAAEVEVNVNTVVRSYDWLSQKDIIFNKRGMGYFVNERASDNIRQSLREDFFRETLPELALQMQKLNISVEEVKNALQALQAKE